MKKLQMLTQYRQMLIESYRIRNLMAGDVMAHERTIYRWAVNNNPKLTAEWVLNSFRKHAGIDSSVQLTEEVFITMPHEVTA